MLRGERDNDLLDAVAETFARDVDARIRSMMSVGYRPRTEALSRVRGRIDHLGTARRRLTESGRIRCRYTEQTLDLPRYRYMLITLRRAAHRASSERVRRRCLTTARTLERSGVAPVDPTAADLSKEQYGHFDSVDRALLRTSRLVRDMCAPEHTPGDVGLPAVVDDEPAFRWLFEAAVRGFYRVRLDDATVSAPSRPWPASGDPEHLAFLPRLKTDAVIRGPHHQTVVECKFAPMFDQWHGKTMIKPGYVRQIHSYASVFAGDATVTTSALLIGGSCRRIHRKGPRHRIDRYPCSRTADRSVTATERDSRIADDRDRRVALTPEPHQALALSTSARA
ncbi:hypothetical protein ACFOJ6_18470 [Gordonia humi]|uniref:5-methylcytosine restriction system specificity protein McrC n=1 Tax=Gordonia humi TaxID=686429 RepID=UPI00360E524C